MKAWLWRDVLFFGRTGGLFNSFALRFLFEHRPVENVVIAGKGYPMRIQLRSYRNSHHQKCDSTFARQIMIISVDLDTLDMIQLRGVHFMVINNLKIKLFLLFLDLVLLFFINI